MSGFVVVRTGGSPREMGVDFGRAAREALRDLAAESRAHFRQWTGRDIATAKRHAASNYLPFVKRRYPNYLEEVRGIAEGAGIAFEDLFYLTADEELVSLWEKPEKCSSVALRLKRGMLLGHNEDYPPRYMDRLVIVEAHPDGAPAFLALTYPYIIAGPSCGMNDRGMAFAVDSLGYPARVRGVPTNYVLRDLYSARRTADVPGIVDVKEAVMGNAVTVASAPERKAFTIEAAPGGAAVLAMETDGLLAHTNHVRSASLDHTREKTSWSSRRRLAALEHLLSRAQDRTAAGLKKALSSKDHGLLRFGRRANESCTIASAVLDPGRRIMYVAKRGPRGHAFRAYGLGKRIKNKE
ncbi:MAG TPA: C45 family peptidase [Candidatus Eisenbacteria bacterium]|nr:C45 family peptidase [Candidatus Eisenbacteria bacterium]